MLADAIQILGFILIVAAITIGAVHLLDPITGTAVGMLAAGIVLLIIAEGIDR